MSQVLGKTLTDYFSVKRAWLAKNHTRYTDRERAARLALHMTWWVIENVSDDDVDRTDIFFELRPLVRSVPE